MAGFLTTTGPDLAVKGMTVAPTRGASSDQAVDFQTAIALVVPTMMILPFGLKAT
ncbi:hypothetical protein ABIA35_009838 [Catenulispora sp. MAP12-49]